MKAILLLLSLSLIWRGFKDENGHFNIPDIISFLLALAAWSIIMFGNVVE